MDARILKGYSMDDRLADDGMTRLEFTPAHIAVREALANALIHAQHNSMDNVVVDSWIDKIVISNPGSMLVSVTEFYEGQHSVCRNPLLQKMFVFIGVGEKAGSGAYCRLLQGAKVVGGDCRAFGTL
ncbi:MAG: hypothetical protein IKU00_06370 [Bacteroidales bacterium]|nr:hypothetical protein [Bacteroidales bacterium]